MRTEVGTLRMGRQTALPNAGQRGTGVSMGSSASCS